MLVKDVMTDRLELVNRRTTIRAAAEKMAQLDIGALPIVDRGSQLVGMVTDRDITVRGVARGLAAEQTAVEDIMTPGVVSCQETDDLRDLADLMERRGLRRIIVVNDRQKPVGIVSLDDLARRATDKQLAAEALHRRPNGHSLVQSNHNQNHSPG